MARPTKHQQRYKNSGRKTFDGKEIKDVLAKLEQAALIDAPIEEMCFYADISPDAYYRYIKKNPKFRDRIQMLRERLTLKSRQNIAGSIEAGDIGLSKWMLERRKPIDFAETLKLEHGGQINNIPDAMNPELTALQKEYHDKARKIGLKHYQDKEKK